MLDRAMCEDRSCEGGCWVQRFKETVEREDTVARDIEG